jgi:hypothetical protein
MSEIASERIAITTAGAAGSAVGSGISVPINGFLLDIYLEYNVASPITTDVTISHPTFGNILVVTNNAASGWYAPRKQTCDPAAAATGMYDLIPLSGPVTITIAQADAITDSLIVTLRWMTP